MNDEQDLRIGVVLFAMIILILTLGVIVFPIIALFTVPKYFELFLALSYERVSLQSSGSDDDSSEEE